MTDRTPTLRQRMHEEPMSWKDWVTAAGLALTLAAVLLQGGRMIERIEATNARLADLTQAMDRLQGDQTRMQSDVTQQRGIDRLHEEQIHMLRRDVDRMQPTRRSVQ